MFRKKSKFAACEMIATALYGIARLYSHLRKYIKFRHIAMNQQTKEVLYLSPDVMVFEVKTEGVICSSGRVQDYIWNQYEEE